jgi:hypothetical protein
MSRPNILITGTPGTGIFFILKKDLTVNNQFNEIIISSCSMKYNLGKSSLAEAAAQKYSLNLVDVTAVS